MAFKIQEIAKHNKVEVFSAPPLARALYYNSKIGETIPSELYLAVAQILAYVLQVKNASFSEKHQIVPPGDFEVPAAMTQPKNK